MQDVTFNWKGTEYRVEAREVLPLIAKVEDVITLGELVDASNTGKIKTVQLARAFATALNFAGAKVTDEEVRLGMFTGDKLQAIRSALMVLISMMVPPEALQDRETVGKKKAGAELPGGSSSKKHSKHV